MKARTEMGVLMTKTNTTPNIEVAAPSRYLTKEEAAALFQVTVRTLDSWLQRRLIPFYRIGRTVRIDADDVRASLQKTCRIGGQAR